MATRYRQVDSADVPNPPTGRYWMYINEDGNLVTKNSAGTVTVIALPGGNVMIGPGPTVGDGEIVLFDGTGGLATKASGVTISTDGTMASDSDALLPTEKAIRAYIAAYIAAQDVQVFKGIIDCSADPDYPAADAGWTYRVSGAGKIGGASGTAVQIDDMLICTVDSSPSGDEATVGANWVIIPTNATGGVVGPVSSVDGGLALFDGTTGALLKGDGLTPSNDDFLQRKSGAWTNRTPAQAAADLQGSGSDVDAAGFRGIPPNVQSGNHTVTTADMGKQIIHDSGAGSGDTYTIDSNANMPVEIGSALTFVNLDSNPVTIAIASDTMFLAGTTTTGSRQLAQNGMATALKVASTIWLISGVGLT